MKARLGTMRLGRLLIGEVEQVTVNGKPLQCILQENSVTFKYNGMVYTHRGKVFKENEYLSKAGSDRALQRLCDKINEKFGL